MHAQKSFLTGLFVEEKRSSRSVIPITGKLIEYIELNINPHPCVDFMQP